MTGSTLTPEPLTAAAFAPFGSVLEENQGERLEINEARFDRFARLATIDIRGQNSFVNTSIMRCRVASRLPLPIDTLERHPLGSQAFMPLQAEPFYVVVAEASDTLDPSTLRAFVSNGQQGINYACGVWHLPLIATSIGQRFFVVDCGNDENCDLAMLPAPVTLLAAEETA
ncbi:MAG: ureidoglycolate lyase [Pseudomonadota bacterium]